MNYVIALAGWLGVVLVAAAVALTHETRRRSRERVFEAVDELEIPWGAEAEPQPGLLTRWLALAGFRQRGAAAIFVSLSLLMAAFGAVAGLVVSRSGLISLGLQGLLGMPGGTGDIFLPFLYLAPWMAFAIVALSPWLKVRAARRARVLQIEQDLPITLELLATLAEAGLGFDAAVERVVASQPSNRPLTVELRTFQLDLLGGRPRVHALRRLSQRVAVSSLTMFVSAVVQAEQIGSGLAIVLRQQADDLRERRRERALQFAMALPVKRLFPLIICFLPGVFVATLGPTFYQFFQFVDAVVRSTEGGAR